MRRFHQAALGIAFGAASAVAMSGLAIAADLPGGPYYTTPEPLSVYSWAGPYLGATLGYEWGGVDNSLTHPSGIAGGVEAGYNWQRGAFVFGGETDIQLSGADDTMSPYEFSNPWFGTVRGRAGVSLNNVLVYGTAGLAYGNLRADTFNLTESHTDLGWVAGAGVEVGFTPHWSAKAEWLYLDLADSNFSVTGNNNGLAADLLRMGVNYHF
ncbi:MAG TPA: outer membrane protein [Xanthobacteraceae bacterium]|nr:outer membrane protein [Xanthobacteraceae bacterium]